MAADTEPDGAEQNGAKPNGVEPAVERRLAAILYGDVVSYSRLMREDDAATLTLLSRHRQIVFAHVTSRGGRVVNAPGDSLLAEFPSVVEAVEAARAAQRDIAASNAALPASRRMWFRIGVNLGDVLVADGSIYGDGVNMAARLESLAEPGGVNVSANVYELLKDRPPLQFGYVGRRAVKNFPRPVAVYRIVDGSEPRRWSWRWTKRCWRTWPRARRVGLAAALLVPGLLGWGLWSRLPDTQVPAAQAGLSWALNLPLPDKPVVAVLPFDNLSGRQELEWMADGLTETLITDLARLHGLAVIARNSVFTFKGSPVNVQEAGQVLGANYIVEGSIQHGGDRVRINVQLIDARTGQHVWAERYDAPDEGLFQVQDQVVLEIVDALDVQLLEGDLAALRQPGTTNPKAFRELRQAEQFWYADGQGQHCNRYERTGGMIRKAIEIDPAYSSAWVAMAWHHLRAVYFGCGADRAAALRAGMEAAEQAIALRPSDGEAHTVQALARLFLRDYDGFLQSAAEGGRLGGNHPEVLANLAWGNLYVGRYDEAKQQIRRAIRLHPYYPAWYLNVLAIAELWEGNLADGADALRISRSRNPRQLYVLVYSVVLHQAAGRSAAAREAALKLRTEHPDFTVATWLRDSDPYRPPEAERLAAWLHAAGVP